MTHVCDARRPGQACNPTTTKCSMGFPKPYATRTSKVDGAYPLYRRRSPSDGGQTYVVNAGKTREYTITNADIVPYNKRSLIRTNAHVCVEICASISAVKYLFKYILKGPDHIRYKIVQDDHTAANIGRDHSDQSSTNHISSHDELKQIPIQSCARGDVSSTDEHKHSPGSSDSLQHLNRRGTKRKRAPVNEVQNFKKARWICAPEADWRIFGFTKYKQMPSVERLGIHLENQQQVMISVNNRTADERRNIPARAA